MARRLTLSVLQVAQDFVEDLCNVVQLPEFPGAAILLDWFARVLINTLKDSEQTSGLRKEALKNGTDMVRIAMLLLQLDVSR